ncbi:MAG: hypothetical protein ACRC4M_00585 [Mycoplasma sp.]
MEKITVNSFFIKNKSLIINISLLLFTIISAIQIPYIGQFIDATLFGFLFGYSKYILYIYLIILFTLKIFKGNTKILQSKRFIIFLFSLAIVTSTILGSIQLFTETNISIKSYIVNIWYEIHFDFNNIFSFASSNYINGGLISSLLSNWTPGLIIIASLVFLLVISFFIFPTVFISMRNKLQNFLPAKKDETDPILIKKTVFKNWKNNNSQHSTNTSISKMYKFDDITIDNSVDINKEVELLKKYFITNSIKIKEASLNETQQTYNVTFYCDEENLIKLKHLKETFNLIGLNATYRFILSDEFIIFQYPKTKQLINELLLNLLTSSFEGNSYIGCYDHNQLPIYFDLEKHYFIGVFDSSASNIQNYINHLILAISVRFNTNNMLLSFISPINNNLELIKTPIRLKNKINSMESLKTFIDKLYDQTQWTIMKLRENKVASIYEFKDNKNIEVKNHTVIIDEIDFIKKNDSKTYQKIIEIGKYASICGINLICIDKSADGISYDDIEYSTIYCFKSSIELSNKLFKSKASHTLSGLGTAILKYQSSPKTEKVNFVSISLPEFEYLNLKFNDIKK